MKEIQISGCDLEEKIEKICVKIKENENINDLRKIFEKNMKLENLFFYKKDLTLINKEKEKNIKIIDCLNENEIKFSINLKLIIKIENKKNIEYDLENLSLFELRNKLGDEIDLDYKFYNEKGIILDEKNTNVFDIIKKNKIKIKKLNEKMCELFKIKKSDLKNNESINKNENEKKEKNIKNNNIEKDKNDKNLKNLNKKENSKNNNEENENIDEIYSENNLIKKYAKNDVNNLQKGGYYQESQSDNHLFNNKFYLQNCKKLDINSIYDYYLYPNNNFNSTEEKNCISILLIGESGVGKTTFINSLLNFIMNVKNDDEHRFLIVYENNKKNKEFLSQTKEVNIYYIKSHNNYPPIKIIDTPGFGDTQGIDFDNKIMSMIYEKFKTIKELNSVCIISKSNNARLNFSERYIFNNIYKLFANDLISNFIFLFTFCDIQEPLSINQFKLENSNLNNIIKKIEQPWFLQFNNSGFFTENQTVFTKEFIEMSCDSFKKLIEKLKKLKKCSLKLSEKINEKRIDLDNIYKKIQNTLITLNNKYSNYYNKLTNNEKKEIFNLFYIYENFIQEYNNISIKESKENLNIFLNELIEKNNLSRNLITDLLSSYDEKKKKFENNIKYYETFEKFLKTYYY